MMKRLAVVAFVFASLAALVLADEEEFYSDKYDHLDIDAVLANDRLRNQYYKCFLDTGPCITPDAIFIKERFPEAIVTKCRKCTPRQKNGFEQIAIWFHENDPEAWDAVIRKAVMDFQTKGLQKKPDA